MKKRIYAFGPREGCLLGPILAEKPPGSLKLTERPPEEINAATGEPLMIECEFWGWPTPSMIFWMKDDMPIVQLKRMTHATQEDPKEAGLLVGQGRADTGTELGTVRARLYLPCVSTQDSGLYTCIAESPLGRKAAAKTMLNRMRSSGLPTHLLLQPSFCIPGPHAMMTNTGKSQRHREPGGCRNVNELPSQECDQKDVDLPPAVLLSRGVLGQGQGTSAVLLCRTAGGVVSWVGPNSERLETSKKYHVSLSLLFTES
ncbi:unnamed protein product [Notodromas monacha]|uniref:Ig-like domain-containing protein n=1 Tax=Notodromas monacha TaxID=399045 RepID=A0A7R9BVH6_9CRUS|nr:unnamed protein product [Notodromas monacha]CAG0921370.1 unnamed protein product [Notodromas monacha]